MIEFQIVKHVEVGMETRRNRCCPEMGISLMAKIENMNEEELIFRLIKGDPNTWNDFVEHYGPRILDSLRAMKTNLPSEDLDELVHVTFVAFWKALPKFRNECTVLSFLRKIAKRKALTEIRRRDAQKRDHKKTVGDPEKVLAIHSEPAKDPLESGPKNLNIETLDEDFAERLSFSNVFKKLAKRCRTLIALRFYAKLKVNQIYETLKPSEPELKPQHVHLQLHRCIRNLKKRLLETDNEKQDDK